jgi:prepilin-type processing-associated H-X9-DG protein
MKAKVTNLRKKTMKSRTFFTKKDLFVTVFCIIFMLMNIAAVSGGRKRAKELLCASNLRQWGIIFLTFANDNNGSMMGGWQGAGEECTPEESLWMGALMPYYGENNYQLLCCPTAANPKSPSLPMVAGGTFATWGPLQAYPPLWNVPNGCYGSYGINDWVCNPTKDEENPYSGCIIPMSEWMGYGRNSSPYWKSPNVRDAGNVPCFLDSIYLNSWPHHATAPQEYEEEVWLNYDNQTGGFNINRHEGAVNAVYLDGSVRRIGLKSLWYQKWHRYYDFNEVLPLDSPDWPEWMKDFE